jgi:hypothetical protein
MRGKNFSTNPQSRQKTELTLGIITASPGDREGVVLVGVSIAQVSEA